MRFAGGKNNVDAGEAMELATNAIRKTVAALADFNLEALASLKRPFTHLITFTTKASPDSGHATLAPVSSS